MSAVPEVLLRRAERSAQAADPYAEALDAIGDATIVCIGEASHGTHEFYRDRAELTKRLILERGFVAVAAEADWPDALRVGRYVAGRSDDADASEALAGFRRFPTWMWRNADVLDFIGWLREANEARPAARRAGFYGLDLYSLHASIGAVVTYLERVDPSAAARARSRYACFDFAEDPQDYAYATGLGLHPSCRDDVVAELVALQREGARYARLDGRVAEDEYFFAEQNARVARAAEEYYRTMLDHRTSSWNLRDRHMVETLVALEAHLGRRASAPKIVLWAHNSHLGDARATEMSRRGEHNVGQLVRERYGGRSRLVGFTTYTGTVSAASDWDAPVERKHVRPGLAGSYEQLFHRAGVPRFTVRFDDPQLRAACRGPLLERAIGVIYRPETERGSHYFAAELSSQFDVLIHVDHTRAVEPLERTARWEAGEIPETYPSGV